MSGGKGLATGRVRIIGGTLRNSRLEVPNKPGLRPTPQRVRETLFNWLAPSIDGASCLDLCAGTGALGIEALSRGADHVQFVERDPVLAGALRQNLQRLNMVSSHVDIADASVWLAGDGRRHDLVFLDPPFAADLWTSLSQQLECGGWLAPTALVYVEAPRGAVLLVPLNWVVHREATAGEVRFALYRRVVASVSDVATGGEM